MFNGDEILPAYYTHYTPPLLGMFNGDEILPALILLYSY
jgi:hypothetical protein